MTLLSFYKEDGSLVRILFILRTEMHEKSSLPVLKAQVTSCTIAFVKADSVIVCDTSR